MAEYRMDVERDEGEPLGATVDEALTVTKIVPTSLSDGHMQTGDQILTINEKKVQSKEHLYQLLRYAHPRLRVVVKRQASAAEAEVAGAAAAAPNMGISPEMEKLLRRRTGFVYLGVEIDWESNRQRALGIVLSNRTHRVIVSALKPGSLGEEKLKLLDRFLAVNGTPVSDKDVAKQIIIQSGGKFQVTVERPVSDEAKKEFSETAKQAAAAAAPAPAPVPAAPAAPEPAPTPGAPGADLGRGDTSILPVDVLEVVRAEIIKLRAGGAVPQPGVLRGPAMARQSSRLLIRSQSRECFIISDMNPAKRIRHVPKADPENLLPKEQ